MLDLWRRAHGTTHRRLTHSGRQDEWLPHSAHTLWSSRRLALIFYSALVADTLVVKAGGPRTRRPHSGRQDGWPPRSAPKFWSSRRMAPTLSAQTLVVKTGGARTRRPNSGRQNVRPRAQCPDSGRQDGWPPQSAPTLWSPIRFWFCLQVVLVGEVRLNSLLLVGLLPQIALGGKMFASNRSWLGFSLRSRLAGRSLYHIDFRFKPFSVEWLCATSRF